MRFTRASDNNSPSVSSTSPTAVPQSIPPHQRQSRSSRRQQHQQRAHTRYQFNHMESGMPVNFWGIDRRDVWRTCFCFHVRTVTIFIGVWHLMVYILCLSFIAAMFMYEPSQDGFPGGLTMRPDTLPTPMSKTSGIGDYANEIPQSDSLRIDQTDGARLDTLRNGPLNIVMETKKANSQVVLLTLCNMLITLLMVYGAVRGKPSYLMPFFVLRVFDFCIFCLTMVGYFSYLPNVTEGIVSARWLPFREYLLSMDTQILSLLTLVVIVATIAVKAYIIGVIWNCYKYLMLRNSVIRTVIAYRHDDPTNIMGLQQNLLPDLPDYETAVNDPRYAKKPPLDSASATTGVNAGNPVTGASSIAMPPPPPYSVAIASEPLTFNFTVPTPTEHATSENRIQQSPLTDEQQIESVNETLDTDTPSIIQSHSNSTVVQVSEPVYMKIEVAPLPAVSTDSIHQ